MTNLNKSLKRAVEEIHGIARLATVTDGGHKPTLFVFKKDGSSEVVDFELYLEDRNLMSTMIKAYQSEDGVAATVLLTEAWMLKVKKDSEEGKHIEETGHVHIMPSESPDRIEVLFYMIETRDDDFAAQALIHRDEDNAISSIDELTYVGDSDEAKLTGRLIGGSIKP